MLLLPQILTQYILYVFSYVLFSCMIKKNLFNKVAFLINPLFISTDEQK